jgi:hypothetical protein
MNVLLIGEIIEQKKHLLLSNRKTSDIFKLTHVNVRKHSILKDNRNRKSSNLKSRLIGEDSTGGKNLKDGITKNDLPKMKQELEFTLNNVINRNIFFWRKGRYRETFIIIKRKK